MFLTRASCFAIICFSGAIICEVCDFKDENCLTKAAKNVYVSFIAGVSKELSSDPLHLDMIVANLPSIKFKLFNVSLTGLKNCHVDLMRINQTDLKYDYNIGCPFITLESDYEIEGYLGSKFLEGKGTLKHDYYDYFFFFHGNFTQYEKAGKNYVHMTDHVLAIEAKGRVHYAWKGLYHGNKEKSDALHTFANENWSFVDKIIRQPIMEACMRKLMDNGNAFLEVMPVNTLFPRD